MSKILAATVLALTVTLAPALAAFDPNRIVTAVDAPGGTFSCRAGAGEATYTYKTTGATVFRTSGARVKLRYVWNKGGLSDIKVGDVVTVQYHLHGGERIADRVAIYHKP
jgi:hypothetical protein